MISQRIARMLSWLVPYSCCAAALLASPLTGRAQPAQQDEVKAVVRISKELIDDVLAKVEVTGTIPYDARLLGLRVQGLAYGRGKLMAEVLTQDGKATVVAHGKGTGETYAYATLGPVLPPGMHGPILPCRLWFILTVGSSRWEKRFPAWRCTPSWTNSKRGTAAY